MNTGGKAVLLVTTLCLAGCATAPKPVSIRAIADPSARIAQGDLATARGQLALGNVGLALEAFRNIQRERPTDPAPLAGIGDCYAAMGRFDLADSNYQAALSFAPRDPALLMGLAGVYQRQGDRARAAELRGEAALAAAPPAPVPVTFSPQVATAGAEQTVLPAEMRLTSSVTVQLPPARPVQTLASAAAVSGSPLVDVEDAPRLSSTVTMPLPPARPARDRDVSRLAERTSQMADLANAPQLASNLTMPLPPVRSAPSPEPRPQRRPDAQSAVTAAAEPRLERLSRGEVALVTTGHPLWRAGSAPAKLATADVRWVPLRDSTETPNVQILNAARRQGLAGSARTVLLGRGWRKIAVSDAGITRDTSIIFYPANRAKLARSLAAQFGIAARQIQGDRLVLVLGRDAVGLAGNRRRS